MKNTLLILILISGLVISCQKNDSNSNTPAPVVVTAHQYGYNNGVCYDYTANVNADPSLCSQQYNNTNNGYYWNGVNCMSSYNGQIVTSNFCNNNYYNNFNNNTRWVNGQCVNNAGQVVNQYYCASQAYTGQCQGLYISYKEVGSYFQYYRTYQCWGSNCRGKTLTEYSTGREVLCQ